MIYSFTRCQLKTQHDTNSAAATAQLRVQLRIITVRQTGRCPQPGDVRVKYLLQCVMKSGYRGTAPPPSHGEVQDSARIHSKLTLHFLLLEGTHLSERVRLQTGSERLSYRARGAVTSATSSFSGRKFRYCSMPPQPAAAAASSILV